MAFFIEGRTPNNLDRVRWCSNLKAIVLVVTLLLATFAIVTAVAIISTNTNNSHERENAVLTNMTSRRYNNSLRTILSFKKDFDKMELLKEIKTVITEEVKENLMAGQINNCGGAQKMFYDFVKKINGEVDSYKDLLWSIHIVTCVLTDYVDGKLDDKIPCRSTKSVSAISLNASLLAMIKHSKRKGGYALAAYAEILDSFVPSLSDIETFTNENGLKDSCGIELSKVRSGLDLMKSEMLKISKDLLSCQKNSFDNPKYLRQVITTFGDEVARKRFSKTERAIGVFVQLSTVFQALRSDLSQRLRSCYF